MEWDDIATTVWFLPIAAATALILRLVGGRVLKKLQTPEPPRIFPGMQLRSVIGLQKHRPMARLKDPPNFGLVFHVAYLAPFIIFIMMAPRVATGLLVDLRQTRAVIVQSSATGETLGIYVDAKRRFFLNEQLVSREDLGQKLKEELGRRAAWTVYFEADRDSIFMDTAFAIDTIQSLGAKVIWITPKMRAEIQKSAS